MPNPSNAALDRLKRFVDGGDATLMSWEDMLGQARSLPAGAKVDLLKAMGFQPIGSDHQPDCPYAISSGLRCECVPPATQWSQPHDVDVYRNETWEDRLKAAKEPRRIPAAER